MEEREAFKRRAAELSKRLDAAKGQSETLPKVGRTSPREVDGSGMGAALRTSTELIGGVVVGGGIGWMLDWALRTGPLFFILFFLLGAAAGIMNVFRASRTMNTPPPQNADATVSKDED
ncbi:MAG: ATP F0F1 synthase subunit I [Rhodospirillales bacterium]|nr:ATP F0F1 synthase subunit I [Rhodospirillales bacterium]